MRSTLTIFAMTVAIPAASLAEDVFILAPATSAVIFQRGAILQRTAEVDLPAGEHRILVPASGPTSGSPRIALTGATLGAIEGIVGGVVDGRTLFTPEQAAAHDAWLAATAARDTTEDDRQRAFAAIKEAEDRLTFFRSITGASLTALDAAAVATTADTVAQGTAQAERDRADAREALRVAERALEEASLEVQQARRELDATGANFGPVDLIAITANLTEPGPVALSIEAFSDNAGWSTEYDANLTADDQVIIDRRLVVRQSVGLPMTQIALTLSTADAYARTAPSVAFPNQAQIFDPGKSASFSSDTLSVQRTARIAEDAAAGAFSVEPVVVPTANTDGPVVSYDYPVPVSLPGDGQGVTLSLDQITLDARVFNRAIPRQDETAYLVADMTNGTAEPLLPGPVTLYREDALIGGSNLPLLPAGGDYELAFGPQQHLRLEYRALENETGDRGLFVSSGTRTQDLVFRIRNLSGVAETVEARFALPFSEQEDLEVDVTTVPKPASRDIEDRRGVAQWDLTIAPGAEAEVQIGVTLEWPEGQQLNWQP